MTSQGNESPERHEQRVEEARREAARKEGKGAPESAESRETLEKREQRPGDAGLANEARPGLGTRADEPEAVERSRKKPHPPSRADDGKEPKATPRGYEEPRPEPREQPPDSIEHEEERSTGVSGHLGSD